MINLIMQIRNPFFKDEDFKSFWDKHGRLTTHKFWEIQYSWYPFNLFEFRIDTNVIGRDHAGIELEVGLFGYYLELKVYDHRHWDDENFTWMEYDGSEEEESSASA